MKEFKTWGEYFADLKIDITLVIGNSRDNFDSIQEHIAIINGYKWTGDKLEASFGPSTWLINHLCHKIENAGSVELCELNNLLSDTWIGKDLNIKAAFDAAARNKITPINEKEWLFGTP